MIIDKKRRGRKEVKGRHPLPILLPSTNLSDSEQNRIGLQSTHSVVSFGMGVLQECLRMTLFSPNQRDSHDTLHCAVLGRSHGTGGFEFHSLFSHRPHIPF